MGPRKDPAGRPQSVPKRNPRRGRKRPHEERPESLPLAPAPSPELLVDVQNVKGRPSPSDQRNTKIFLTRCFSPCPDEIIGYYRRRRRAGGLRRGQTASLCTQHNEAPFESDRPTSGRGAILFSEIDNRLFRPTLPLLISSLIQTCAWLCCVAWSSSFLPGCPFPPPRRWASP